MRLPAAADVADAFVAGRAQLAPLTEAAFTDFYARTSGPLGGYLRRLTGNVAVAEELVQDAYVRFLSAYRVPEEEDHRRHYLFRIATNLARDHFRRTRTDTRMRDAVRADSDRRATSVGSRDVDAGDLQAVLSRLSPRDRELLLLAYVEGLTHQEIAAVTGLMRASIKPLLFRARRRFAAALGASGVAAASIVEKAP